MNKILWYFKQLFPLIYWSKYKEGEKNIFTIWKMWFGKCYNIKNFNIGGYNGN